MQHDLPVLVIGASGKTGRRVADRLESINLAVRRGSRSGETRFDWGDRSTWAPALEGVVAAYVVYSPDLAVPAAAEAIAFFSALAEEKGVHRVVLLSGRGEDGAQRSERALQESGLEWTVIRASWFDQNFDEGAFADLVRMGEVALPVGDVPEPFIDIDDIAEVAVAALTADRHVGELYEVTGPRLLTFADAMREIGEEAGRDVRYVEISAEAFRAGLEQAGAPAVEVDLLGELFGTLFDGRNAHVTDGVERALGRPARDSRDYARRVAATGVWSASTQEV
ncbi:MAG: NAD(P)H-binding protein [Planctomycetota bacterium]